MLCWGDCIHPTCMHASIICLLGTVERNAQDVNFCKVADDWQIKRQVLHIAVRLMLLLLLLLLENLLQMHCSPLSCSILLLMLLLRCLLNTETLLTNALLSPDSQYQMDCSYLLAFDLSTDSNRVALALVSLNAACQNGNARHQHRIAHKTSKLCISTLLQRL